jgi:hypothetical protein
MIDLNAVSGSPSNGIVLAPNDPSKPVLVNNLADHQQAQVSAQSSTEATHPAEADAPHSADSLARETSDGPVKDVVNWDDQAVLAGMKAECADFRAIDANYPGKYHRLGAFIIELTTRLGADDVRQMLRMESISRTTAYRAEQIARLYTYDQAVGFTSVRAIMRTLPQKQPRQTKRRTKDNRRPAELQNPRRDPPADTAATMLDQFIQLGIHVKELLGDAAVGQAIEQIKNHVIETFDEAFREV